MGCAMEARPGAQWCARRAWPGGAPLVSPAGSLCAWRTRPGRRALVRNGVRGGPGRELRGTPWMSRAGSLCARRARPGAPWCAMVCTEGLAGSSAARLWYSRLGLYAHGGAPWRRIVCTAGSPPARHGPLRALCVRLCARGSSCYPRHCLPNEHNALWC